MMTKLEGELTRDLADEQARLDFILDRGLTIKDRWHKYTSHSVVWVKLKTGARCVSFMYRFSGVFRRHTDSSKLWREAIDRARQQVADATPPSPKPEDE